MNRYALIMSVIPFTWNCSYKPEDPGLCKLNCSGAIIGSNDVPLSMSLKSATTQVTCDAGAAGQVINDPFFAQFLISEAFEAGTAAPGQRPVPFISIEPIVNGLRSDLPEHNPNVEINGDIFTPARYKGIITPKDNWCSDTCGVVTIEVAAVCPPAGSSSDISIQMHSGALYSDIATFTATTLSPQ
ncbi:MAG TPA: hypothetical protein VE954_38460 [Oligoflexus sp.]|uniref:hypothetical protein n=1 Tax=Oligoflexus sp. TaxID=1971216 RepID=UPI002D22C111|nr:hypothetical protein [Oligoflexus sp.]HYX39024.1 hypothetical protein [Oligoflexus sp.]